MITFLIVDFFIGFFLNPFNLVMLAIALCFGIIIGLLFRPGWRNVVMKITPNERRFVDFPIKEETAISIECEKVKGFPQHRFIKLNPGFIGKVGRFLKRSVTRYIGKEGTAYLWKMTGGVYTEIKGGLPTVLAELWGQKFYDKIPDKQREKIEENKIMVTVDLSEGLTPEGFKPVSEEDIKKEEDRKAAETLWQGKKQLDRGAAWDKLIYAIAGFGVCAVLIVLGIMGG